MPARRFRALVAAACAVIALLPLLPAPATAQTRERLRQIEETRRRAEETLQGLERSGNEKVARLQETAARRAALLAELKELDAELSAARGALDEAENAIATAVAQRTQQQGRLDDARGELSHGRDVLARRVRSAYVNGRPGSTLAIPRIDEPTDAGRAVEYLERVAEREQEAVDEVAALSSRIDADVAELAEIQERRRAAEEAALAQRDRLAALVAEQEAVTAAAEQEAEAQRVALDAILADEGAHEALLADLEAESQRLEAQLRSEAAAAAAARAAREAAERRRASTLAAEAEAEAVAEAGRRPGATPVETGGRLLRPVSGTSTSGFGYRQHPIYGDSRLHAGIDFAASCGTPIHAAEAGVVSSVGWRGGYGNAVVLVHPSGIATLYAHQSRLAVESGQSVNRGELIGEVGTTGASTGCHLHFEVRVDGRPVDPSPYL